MGTASAPAGWPTGSDRIKQDYVYAIAVVSSLFAILFARYVARYMQAYITWVQAGRLLSKQFPSPPSDSLIMGHAPSMQSPRNHRWLSDIHKQLGPLIYIRLAHNHCVLITDPNLLPRIFDRALYPPTSNVLDRPVDEMIKIIDLMTSDSGHSNLLTAKTGSQLWRLVRKGVAPAFNPQNIRQGFVYVLEADYQLIEVLKGIGPERAVDMDDAAQRTSLEVIGRVGFGKTFGCLESLDHPAEGDAFKMVAVGLEEVAKRLSNPLRAYMPWNEEVRKGDRAMKSFQHLIRTLLKEVKARGLPSEDDPTIAGHLLRLRDQSGQPLSDDALHAEFSVMFIAGTDTTGHTIANTLYLISQHPDADRKIAEELDSLDLLVTRTRRAPRQLQYADLSRMPYLSGAIRESMRMMAVVGSGVGRVAKQEMQLGPYTIPKGTILWAPIQAIHSSPALWDQPDAFIPERWMEDDAEFWKPSNASAADTAKANDAEAVRGRRYLPFGDGMRSCVGQSLAKMNYTATVALLLSHFSFRLADRMGGPEGVQAAEVSRIAVAPRNGMWLHAVPRA